MPLDRCNIYELDLAPTRAHEGEGLIHFARIADRAGLEGSCNFIDLAELPPGTSVGLHTHEASEEEFYLVLTGTGQMTRNGETFAVRPGDLIRNPPGGTHSLRNSGSVPLRIFVFEVEARR